VVLVAALVSAPPFFLSPDVTRVAEPLLGAVLVVLVAALWHTAANPVRSAAAEFHAFHDALTGLPNRPLFDDRLERALARTNRTGNGTAVMVIDLDGFKAVNDTYGHAAGDALLQAAALRLAAAVRECDTVARIGGDEFGVVLSGIDIGGARESAIRMHESLETGFPIDAATVNLGASIGIALYSTHGLTADLLMKHADDAMYDAKRAGVGYAVFDAVATSTTTERRRLAAELGAAVRADELSLHYQPRLDLRTDEIVAMEALARWQHPTLGLLAAKSFMKLAEENGLDKAICEQVVRAAATQSARWQGEDRSLNVAVNVDARSIFDANFPSTFQRLLEERNVDPRSIEVELSEDAILATLRRARSPLFELAELGVEIVVDDFGTGYSSLGSLARAPISKLKLHPSLLLRAQESEREKLVVAATVSLAHDLGMEVVAEGVESEEGLEFARSLSADYAQGYHIGSPAPAGALTRTLDPARSAA
jgi:diguanylate cyclase